MRLCERRTHRLDEPERIQVEQLQSEYEAAVRAHSREPRRRRRKQARKRDPALTPRRISRAMLFRGQRMRVRVLRCVPRAPTALTEAVGRRGAETVRPAYPSYREYSFVP
jgi:hypothetical protein